MRLKWCPTSKLDQRVRWTRREEDAKEAKFGTHPLPPSVCMIKKFPSRPHSEEAVVNYPFMQTPFLSHACLTRVPGDAIRVLSVLNTFFQTPVSDE